MDISIIWNANKGEILSRFARALSNGTGWPIKAKADPKAGLNYFMLYVQVGQSLKEAKKLPKTAALFSHYEDNIPEKARWWDAAAEAVHIRTTWANQYLERLLPYGESHLVIPPIDQQFLRTRPPRIGIAGYVHPGNRKGEDLVRQLYRDRGHTWELVASGKGWPIPDVREYKWEDMPAFYDSLDLYLLTSTIEGIPMTPLEALTRGKPVVVPYGVGLMDSLESPLVFRYAAGDYLTMMEAIEAALDYGKEDVVKFSEDAWCQSHRIAFGLDAGAEIITQPARARGGFVQSGGAYLVWDGYKETAQFAPIRPVIANSGAICVAYGVPARECAKTLLYSWKQRMSNYPIALVSDSPIGEEDIFIEHPDTDIGARSVKTQLYDIAPNWKNVLYLDADTEIVADVSVLFQWLEDGFDFLICANPAIYASLVQGRRPDNGEELEVTINEIGIEETIQPNGGVFAFSRNERSAALMRGWHSEWQRYGARDQMAFLRALHKNPLRWRLLGQEFNTVTRFSKPSITAGILHHPLIARRWEGIIHGRLDSDEAWERVLK